MGLLHFIPDFLQFPLVGMQQCLLLGKVSIRPAKCWVRRLIPNEGSQTLVTSAATVLGDMVKETERAPVPVLAD